MPGMGRLGACCQCGCADGHPKSFSDTFDDGIAPAWTLNPNIGVITPYNGRVRLEIEAATTTSFAKNGPQIERYISLSDDTANVDSAVVEWTYIPDTHAVTGSEAPALYTGLTIPYIGDIWTLWAYYPPATTYTLKLPASSPFDPPSYYSSSAETAPGDVCAVSVIRQSATTFGITFRVNGAMEIEVSNVASPVINNVNATACGWQCYMMQYVQQKPITTLPRGVEIDDVTAGFNLL